MSRLRHIALLLMTICPVSLYAQEGHIDSLATINGRAFEQVNSKMHAAPDVFVKLISGSDTLATQASVDGSFRFEGVKPGKKTIIASGMRYHPTLTEVELYPGSNAVMVEMRAKYLDLIPAYVLSQVTPVTQRGDTLIYHPAAVKTMEGENAIEILRSMPGVEIKGNEVIINGQKVERAYVNGLLLFGDDPMSPLNAILAQDVREIRTYEEESVETRIKGNKHGRKDRVLDILTKEPLVSAFDAYAQAAAGVDEAPKEDGTLQGRYHAGITANFFSEKFLAYLNTYSNNLGKQENMQTVGAIDGGSLQDYHRTTSAGGGVQKYWGDRLLGSNFSLSYAYNRDHRRSFSRSMLTYPGDISSPQRAIEDSTQSISTEGRHQIHLYSAINDKKLKNWLIESFWTFDNNESQRLRSQWNRIVGGGSYDILEELGGRSSSISGRNSIIWQDMYSTSRVSPIAKVVFNFNPSKGEDWIIDTLASSLSKRYLTTNADGRNMDISTYLGGRIKLWNGDRTTSEMSALLVAEYFNRHSHQIAFDLWDTGGKMDEPATNLANTFDFYRQYIALGPDVDYSVAGKDWNIRLTASPRFAKQFDRELLPSPIQGDKNFFLPSGDLSILYKKATFTYRLMSGIPAVEQYRDRLDDHNPLFLVQGNPDLVRSLTHTIKLGYEIPLPKRAAQISLAIEGKAVSDAIVCKTQYFDKPTTLEKWAYTVQPGATLSSFENSDGTWNIGASARYNKRFQSIGTTLTVMLGATYGQTPYFQSGESMFVRDFTPHFSMNGIVRPNRNLTVRYHYYLDYFKSTNNLGQVLNNGITNGGTLTGQYNFGKLFFVSSGYTFRITNLIETDATIAYHHLRAQVGVNLLKGRMKISVSGNDLLNRGSNYTITTANDHTVETWTPSYGRYYLLHVFFRLNKLQPTTVYQGQKYSGAGLL